VLVFSETEDVHEEAEALLAQLRAARNAPAKSSLGSGSRAAIRQALAKPVELKYDKLPLGKVAEDLQSALGVPVRLDGKALNDIGIHADKLVTFASSGVSAKAAIGLMLRQLGLALITRYEVLLITTPEEAEVPWETRVYEVSDLVHPGSLLHRRQLSLKVLMELIETSTARKPWGNGWPGSISPFEVTGIEAIVAWQSENVHEQVEALLSQLRADHDVQAEESKSPNVCGTLQLPIRIRHGLLRPSLFRILQGNGRGCRPVATP
jgi:hypothetical protein